MEPEAPQDISFQFFANKSIQRQTEKQLRKSISSCSNTVLLHQDKITHPEIYDSNWGEKDERQKAGLLLHWEKEIRTIRKNIEQAKEELRKRGVKGWARKTELQFMKPF